MEGLMLWGQTGISGILLNRQINMEGRSLARLSFGSDDAKMVFDNLFADSQADARAGVFASAMQSLKYIEYSLVVLGLEADAVIGKGNMTVFFLWI